MTPITRDDDGDSIQMIEPPQQTMPQQQNLLPQRHPTIVLRETTSSCDDVEGGGVPNATAAVSRSSSSSSSSSEEEEEQLIPLSTSEHLGNHRQYWRDIILGVNDGIISTILLVAGVVGGGLSSTTTILLTTISAALAGAFSMFAGEYMATKSQNEVMHGEINLERLHLQKYHQDEMKELDGLLELIGISPSEHTHLRDQLVHHYEHNFESLLKIMVALEFGMIEEEIRSPVRAGLASGLSYAIGAMPSVLPFAICTTAKAGLIAATIGAGCALMLVGAIKTWATRGHLVKSAVENLAMASVGGVLAYAVGVFFSKVVN
jgi:VIT1/CCC1 family predicted Fe2+/Mn2+ transporter